MPVTVVPDPRTAVSIRDFLASIGPGIVLIGYNIGTGTITTMAATGAAYGLALVWPVLLSCVFTYVLIVAFGKYTVVTGQTALFAFRAHHGRTWSLLVLVALLISEAVSVAGVMGIVVQVIQEWSRPLTASGNGFSPVWMGIVLCGGLYLVFLRGRHVTVERVLGVFVTLMGLCFLLTLGMVMPEPKTFLTGLVPSLPEDANSALLIAGMTGTTMSGVIYVVRTTLVREKGWTIAHLRIARRDALISASLMFVLSFAVMAAAAATLFPLGLRVDNAIDMVRLFEPLAGRFAVSLFVVGIVAAGLSSVFPNLLLAPWLLADYRGVECNLSSTPNRIIVGFVAAIGLTVPIFGGRPVFVMILSQVFGAIVTPTIIGLMWLLLNRSVLMGGHRLRPLVNAVMGFVFVFATAMAAIGIFALLGLRG